MRKFLSCLLIAVFVMLAFVPKNAEALYGLNKWYLGVVDERGQLITNSATINVYTAGTTTSATIYSDVNATAKTNPWTVTDGKINFFSSATSLDLVVNVGSRAAKISGLTEISTHVVIIPEQGLSIQKVLPLPLTMWADVNTGDLIDAGEAPGISAQNSVLAIDWADGEAAEKASVTFRVPYDYESDGKFRVWLDTTAGDAGGTALDYEVYVNQDVTAFDSAVTNQTPVLADDNPGSPSEHDLAVTTDFSSLAAGNLVTLNAWRDDTTYTGIAGLELYYAEFVYTAKQ